MSQTVLYRSLGKTSEQINGITSTKSGSIRFTNLRRAYWIESSIVFKRVLTSRYIQFKFVWNPYKSSVFNLDLYKVLKI